MNNSIELKCNMFSTKYAHVECLSPPSCRTELVFSVTRELLKVPSSSLSPPLFTPPNLLSLFSRYVDRQRLELLQEKLQWAASSYSPPYCTSTLITTHSYQTHFHCVGPCVFKRNCYVVLKVFYMFSQISECLWSFLLFWTYTWVTPEYLIPE